MIVEYAIPEAKPESWPELYYNQTEIRFMQKYCPHLYCEIYHMVKLLISLFVELYNRVINSILCSCSTNWKIDVKYY